MFFKKKSADKPDQKLAELADDEHTRTYRLRGDEPDQPSQPGPDSPQAPIEAETEDGAQAQASPPSPPEINAEQVLNEALDAASPPPPPSDNTVPANTPSYLPGAKKAAEPPKSQVLQDMDEAGMSLEEALISSRETVEKERSKKGDDKRSKAERLVTVARFRWYVLLFLAALSVLAWAVEAQLSERVYNWQAWALLAITVLVGFLPYKFLRIPTRAGLASICWGASYVISAVYGPASTMYHNLPAALIWSGLLSLIMIWVGVAIWRKIGRYRVIDIILSIILIYAALGPIWALVDNIMAGAALNLSFDVLAASPKFITSHLPWYLWPMSVTVALILPLAALFSLWDQCSALRRRGARHGGNIFLALAFISLIPYGFLSFNQAVEAKPLWAQQIRAAIPAGEGDGSHKIAISNEKPGAATPEAAEPTPAATSPDTAALIEEHISAETDKEIPAADLPADQSSQEAEGQPQLPATLSGQGEEPAVSLPEEEIPTVEDRLKAAEKRLNQALERIEDLENQLKSLKEDDQTTGETHQKALPELEEQYPDALEKSPELEASPKVNLSSGYKAAWPLKALPEGFMII